MGVTGIFAAKYGVFLCTSLIVCLNLYYNFYVLHNEKLLHFERLYDKIGKSDMR